MLSTPPTRFDSRQGAWGICAETSYSELRTRSRARQWYVRSTRRRCYCLSRHRSCRQALSVVVRRLCAAGSRPALPERSSAPLLFAVDTVSHPRIQPEMRRRCTSVSIASSARSAARQRIPTSARPQVAADIRVIVAMASMGRSLIASGPCPQCRRSSKAQGAHDLSHVGSAPCVGMGAALAKAHVPQIMTWFPTAPQPPGRCAGSSRPGSRHTTGRDLLQEGKKTLGVNESSLFVHVSNTSAIALYERLGFMRIPYPEPGFDLPNSYYMILSGA